MISFGSLKRFFGLNTVVFGLAYAQYSLLAWMDFNVLAVWTTVLIEHAVIYNVYTHIFASKPLLTEGPRPQQFDMVEFVGSTVVHPATVLALHAVSTGMPTSYLYDIVTFIPRSFAFEILFDLFHYWIHRVIHRTPWAYRLIHKKHHEHRYIDFNTTYHMSPSDVLLSGGVPFFLAACIVPVSDYTLIVLYWYKTIIEYAGHACKDVGGSFPQCIWLPKLFRMELYANDHNYHHLDGRFNYSKRFRLWDKVFGTFKETRLIKN